jgi:hypothetical protein
VPKNCSPSFIIAMFLSAVMAYLAIIDTSVRAAFSQLASGAIGGYFALTTPQKREKENAESEQGLTTTRKDES